MTLEAWTLYILIRKCKFVKNKQVSDGREDDTAKTLLHFLGKKIMYIYYMIFDESLFLSLLNFAIFTAIFIIPLRSHLCFDKSEVNSSIYGLCGVEL